MNVIPLTILQKMDADLLNNLELISAHVSSMLPRLHSANPTPQELVLVVQYFEEIEIFLKSNESSAAALSSLGFQRSYMRLLQLINDAKGAREIYAKMHQDAVLTQGIILNISRQTQQSSFNILNKIAEDRQKIFKK